MLRHFYLVNIHLTASYRDFSQKKPRRIYTDALDACPDLLLEYVCKYFSCIRYSGLDNTLYGKIRSACSLPKLPSPPWPESYNL